MAVAVKAAVDAIATNIATTGVAGTASAGPIFGLAFLFIAGAIALGTAREDKSKPKNRGDSNVNPNTRVDPIDRSVKQSVVAQRVLVGEAVTGGAFCFTHSLNGYLVNEYLLAAHECEDITGIILNGNDYTTDEFGYINEFPYRQDADARDEFGNTIRDTSFRNHIRQESRRYMRLNFRLGRLDQPIDHILTENFEGISEDFRQIGHATAGVEYYRGYNQEEFQRVFGNNIPEPLFRVRGLKVFDPRDGSQVANDPTTHKWTRNGALIIAGALTSRTLGRHLTYDDFDLDELKLAADACDYGFEIIPNREYPRGAVFKKYTIDGVIQSTERLLDVLESMLLCIRSRINWSGGSYKIQVARPPSPAERIHIITDNDWSGTATYSREIPSQQEVNTIRAKFRDPTSPSGDLQDAPVHSILPEGNYDIRDANLDLRFITNAYRAQYNMRETLNELQLTKRLTLNIGRKGIIFEPGDLTRVVSDFMPVINGLYKIDDVGMSPDGLLFELKMREYDLARIFNWVKGVEKQYQRKDIVDG